MADKIQVINESFLDISVSSETIDVVVSMEAFIHVGRSGQAAALKEAYRLLRPGGFMIFSDIIKTENADDEVLRPLLEGLKLSDMSTLRTYQETAENLGFKCFRFQSHASNVPLHYSALHKLMVSFYNHPDSSKRLKVTPEYFDKMESRLRHWVTLSPGNIDWGIFTMQKFS